MVDPHACGGASFFRFCGEAGVEIVGRSDGERVSIIARGELQG